jgi:hypothetical protein
MSMRVPGLVVLAGVAVAAGLLVYSALRYPAIFRLSGAGIVLALSTALLLGYLGCGLWAARHPHAAQWGGLRWGLAAGLFWSAEVWCGGPARPTFAFHMAGGVFLALAVVTTVAAGAAVSGRGHREGEAWQAGLLTGLVSGVLLYAFGVIMTLATLPILGHRHDYQAQFATSHAPNMPTFLVGDILTATAAHLVINVVLGLVGGGLGALIARQARQPGGLGHPQGG